MRWVTCADEGELCECPGESAARMIRFGAPGGDRAWDYARVPEGSDAILLCDALSFMHRDPAPGAAKVCQCAHFPSEAVAVAASPPSPRRATDAPPRTPSSTSPSRTRSRPSRGPSTTTTTTTTAARSPTTRRMTSSSRPPWTRWTRWTRRARDFNPNEYAWCGARDGGGGARDGALVRFGSTGEEMYYAMNSSWFRAHPEVRRFGQVPPSSEAVTTASTVDDMARGIGSAPESTRRCVSAQRDDTQYA